MKMGGEYYRALYKFNIIKYKGLTPPINLVKQRIKEAGISRERFEIVYGLPLKTLLRYVNGVRSLSPVHWHLFYDFYELDKFYTNFNAKFKRESATQPVKKIKKEAPVIANNNKSLIDAYRATINK